MNPLRSLKKRIAARMEERHPMMKAILAGEIVILAESIEEKLAERFQEKGASVQFRCTQDVAWLQFTIQRDGHDKEVIIPVQVEELSLRKGRQRAILSFPEDLSENKDAAGLSDLIGPEAFADMVHERSNGMIEVEWPRAILYFERHPELKRVLTTRIGPFPSLVEAFEINECRIEPGRVVLPIRRPGKAKALLKALEADES